MLYRNISFKPRVTGCTCIDAGEGVKGISLCSFAVCMIPLPDDDGKGLFRCAENMFLTTYLMVSAKKQKRIPNRKERDRKLSEEET